MYKYYKPDFAKQFMNNGNTSDKTDNKKRRNKKWNSQLIKDQ